MGCVCVTSFEESNAERKDAILGVFITLLALWLCSGFETRVAAQRMCTVAEVAGLAAVGAHAFADSQPPRIHHFLLFNPANINKTPPVSAGTVEELVRELKSYQVCIDIPKPS